MQDQGNEKKSAFAAQLLKNPNDPFKAALAVFGADTGSALYAASKWVSDEFVLSEQQRLIDEGFEVFGKEELRDRLVCKLLEIVEGERTCNEDRIKAADQIGKLKGLHPKQETTINNNMNVTTNKVMVVKDHGNDDAWEARLREQQRGLTNASASRH